MSDESPKTELEYLAEIAEYTRGTSRRLSYLIFCAVILVVMAFSIAVYDAGIASLYVIIWAIVSIIWGIVGLARSRK